MRALPLHGWDNPPFDCVHFKCERFWECIGNGRCLEKHPKTDNCGYDRNSSIAEDRYVCECGWRDE